MFRRIVKIVNVLEQMPLTDWDQDMSSLYIEIYLLMQFEGKCSGDIAGHTLSGCYSGGSGLVQSLRRSVFRWSSLLHLEGFWHSKLPSVRNSVPSDDIFASPFHKSPVLDVKIAWRSNTHPLHKSNWNISLLNVATSLNSNYLFQEGFRKWKRYYKLIYCCPCISTYEDIFAWGFRIKNKTPRWFEKSYFALLLERHKFIYQPDSSKFKLEAMKCNYLRATWNVLPYNSYKTLKLLFDWRKK